jgi:hypothetical protein
MGRAIGRAISRAISRDIEKCRDRGARRRGRKGCLEREY